MSGKRKISNPEGRTPIYPEGTMPAPCSLRVPPSLWRRYGDLAAALGSTRAELLRAHMEADLRRQSALDLTPSPNREYTSRRGRA